MVLALMTLHRDQYEDINEKDLELYDRLHEGLARFLGYGVSEGLFPESKVTTYSSYFHGLITGAVIHWTLTGGQQDLRMMFGDLAEFFLKGVQQ